MRRPFLDHETAFHQLFDVVRDVGAEVVAPFNQVAHADRLAAHFCLHQSLSCAYAVHPQAIQLKLQHIEMAPVKTLYHTGDMEIPFSEGLIIRHLRNTCRH